MSLLLPGHPTRASAVGKRGRSADPHWNGARSRKRAAHEVRFVGVDGEGVDTHSGHEYVLLSVGDKSLYREDGGRLGWRDIFSFLYACFEEDPGAAYVGFYLGYDFAQWLRGIPENRARMLLDKAGIAARKRTASGMNPVPFPVYIDDWELDMLGDRRLKLRPHPRDKAPWLYVCDAGPFFQTSLLVAVDPENWQTPIVTPEEFAKLRRGKERRAHAKLDEEMIEYNVLENEIMARLMRQLNGGLLQMGVRLKRQQWFGPGQSASAWMDTVNAPTGDEIRMTIPEGARDAARASYFGGWFEDFVHGHIPGTTYEYDVNSAYPFIIARLPCLLHGKWRHGFGNPGKPKSVRVPSRQLRLVYALVKGDDELCGPMLHRYPTGRIVRPLQTRGWIWQHEIDAARRAGVLSYCKISEWWMYDPCDCPAPLRAIADLYELRLRVGKKSPAGRAYRIVYNSAYGKCAQSIGKPKYANPIYASLITAGCRSMILDAIATHPNKTEQLVKVATDGVCFQTPHPTLPLDGKRLGAWSETRLENLTTMRPGIYWDDETRRRVREGKSPKLKSRGINAKDLASVIEEVDKQFDKLDFQNQSWPTMVIPVAFDMVSPKQALARGKWETAGTITKGAVRELTSDPKEKRSTVLRGPSMVGEFRSLAFSNYHGQASTPYDGSFGEALRIMLDDDGLTPDGSVWDAIREAIQ